jgi:hypothetical protein
MATSVSIDVCLNASFIRTLVCSGGSGTCIILLAPLGQLFCGLPLGGGLGQAADLRLCISKNQQIHVMFPTEAVHLRTPVMAMALRGGATMMMAA